MVTNSSTNKSGLSTDLYDVSNFVNDIKKEYTPEVDEDTLMLGTFGYFGSVQSSALHNAIVMSGEFANESIPTRAKFEKNIIAHALGLGVDSLNAIPAKMDVLLTFLEDEIIKTIGGESGEFIFDCDNKIYFDQLEFHPDYDIIIKRIKLNNGSYTYTAMYDMSGDGIYTNPISDITNPYLTPPVVMNVNGTNYLFTACTLRQVEKSTIYKKVLSDNTISSKTVNFEFDSQLAAFDVDVKNSNGNTHLTPVYEGLTSDSQYPYVWYSYMDSSTIRIKFDRNSYSPRINSDVEIRLQTTQGEKGNFKWVAEYPQFSFDSERLGYSNITVEVRPLTGESQYGVDKKSIDELKRIIPKEALSRGSITNTRDLENFFNSIDTNESQMYLYKKRINGIDRLYYTYIVMKDQFSNVIPSNTVNLMLRPDQLFTDVNKSRLILKKGQILKLDQNTSTAFISRFSEGDEALDYSDSFYYVIPYNFAICMDPMYGMYFLTTMDENRSLSFSYINEECMFQYIATSINWKRNYLDNDDKYTLTIEVEQNIANDNTMIEVDNDGNVVSCKVKCFVVFYEDEVPYRYAEGELTAFNNEAKILTFTFTMTSEDYIDNYNRIRIDGLKSTSGLSDLINYGYMSANCKAMIHIVTEQPDYSTSLEYKDLFYDDAILSKIIPGLDGYCISNSYTINNGINFFYNYSDIIYSTVSVEEGEYIPPDEPDPIPTEPPKDYTIGDGEIDEPPSVYTLATEAAVKNAIEAKMKEALKQVPTFETDDMGTLIITKGEEIITVSDDDSTVIKEDEMEDNTENQEEQSSENDQNNQESEEVENQVTNDQIEEQQIVLSAINESAITEVSTDDNYTVGGEELNDPASDKTIATEAGVYNAVQKMTNDIIGQSANVAVNNSTGETTIYDNSKNADIATDPETNPIAKMMTRSVGNAGFTVNEEDATKYHYIIENVPVVKHGYFKNEEMVQYFVSELIRRKNYIDEALTKLEDTFGINFKFVNTYGPSKLFTLDNDSKYINRVNLSLTFRLALQVNYDENIIQYIKDDIKNFIEDINSIDSIHMSNLITEITNKYSESIRFFEFVDMNGYGTSEQHLYSMPMPDDVITPELINVNILDDLTPDINIIIV